MFLRGRCRVSDTRDEMPLDTTPPESAAYDGADREIAMNCFIHDQNVAHYRRLLAEPHVMDDAVRHRWLLKLLADEEKAEDTPLPDA